MTDKNVQLAVLGVVAVIAIVGLVLLFTTAKSGMVVLPNTGDFGQAAGSSVDAAGVGLSAEAQRVSELKKQQDYLSASKQAPPTQINYNN